MLECHNKGSCINYPSKCKECWTTADIYNHYPFYDDAPKPPKVAYLCDRKACPDCSYPTCKHTLDISHAVNFESLRSDGESFDKYMEKEHVCELKDRVADLEIRTTVLACDAAITYARTDTVTDLAARVESLEQRMDEHTTATFDDVTRLTKPIKYPDYYDDYDRTTSGLIEEY